MFLGDDDHESKYDTEFLWKHMTARKDDRENMQTFWDRSVFQVDDITHFQRNTFENLCMFSR